MRTRLFLFWAVMGLLIGDMPLTAAEVSSEDLIGRVQQLTSGRFAGRGSGTPEGEAAVDLLGDWFADFGLQPAFEGSYFQSFALKGEGWTGNDLTGKFSRNVAGVLPGHGALAERYLVVGAHHDHLGRLDPSLTGSGEAEVGSFYAGANDNASGVTVLFELLRALQEDPQSSCRSILFVCFGGEEVGLQGSGFFVSHSPVDLNLVDAMINFDTVGQMMDHRLYVSGVGTTNIFNSLVERANVDGLELTLGKGGWSGSDHMSFNTQEVPVLFIFGGPYRQYNTVDDIWPTLNVEGLVQIVSFSHRLTKELMVLPDELPWVMVAEKLRADTGEAQNKNTWFGSLPDFTEDVKGYQLAGVFSGSPAEKAGLKKGDVLIKLAGREVVDLATFTSALRAHEPGTLVEVTVLRSGNTLNFTVALGDRKNRK